MKECAFLILAVMIAFAVPAGLCGASDQTVKVGLIAELTGDIPAVGASCKDAAEMAVREINEAGGITIGNRKYKMELFIEDSSDKPDQAADAARQAEIVRRLDPFFEASAYGSGFSNPQDRAKLVEGLIKAGLN